MEFVLLVAFLATCVILIFKTNYWRQCHVVKICIFVFLLLCAVGCNDSKHKIYSDSFNSGSYRVITCVENGDYV